MGTLRTDIKRGIFLLLAIALASWPVMSVAAYPFGSSIDTIGGTKLRSIKLADFNSDGNLDVVAANETSSPSLRVLYGDGSGEFVAQQSVTLSASVGGLDVADFNSDGKPDVVVVTSDGILALYRNNGTDPLINETSIPVPAGAAPTVRAQDFLGDTNIDLLVTARTGSTEQITTIEATGGFAFLTPASYSLSADPSSAQAVELNGDSSLDIVSVGTDGTINIQLSDTMGGFGAVSSTTVGTSFSSLASADFDGDGSNDIVATDATEGKVYVLFGNGLGSFGSPVSYTVASNPRGVIVANVNGDAYSDILFANGGSSSVSVMLGQAAGAFNVAESYAVAANPFGVAVGDVDGDADPDAVISTNDTRLTSLLSVGSLTNTVVYTPHSSGVVGGTAGVSEGGPSESVTMHLFSSPSADVVLSCSMVGSQAVFNPDWSDMTFTTENFAIDQSFTLRAVDDAVIEGNHSDQIDCIADSLDVDYDGLTFSINVGIVDDDVDTDGDGQTNALDSDDDSDGIADAVEDGGPRSGDINGSGVKDSLEVNVASLVNPLTGHYQALVAPATCSGQKITQYSVEVETSFAELDDNHDYQFGLNKFTIHCNSPGQTIPVEFWYDTTYDINTWTYRKYLSYRNEYVSIDDRVTYANQSNGLYYVTTARFNITDGGELDADQSSNGDISDPSGPSTDLDTPGGGAGSGSGGGGTLAETGANPMLPTMYALMLLAAVYALQRSKKAKGSELRFVTFLEDNFFDPRLELDKSRIRAVSLSRIHKQHDERYHRASRFNALHDIVRPLKMLAGKSTCQ